MHPIIEPNVYLLLDALVYGPIVFGIAMICYGLYLMLWSLK